VILVEAFGALLLVLGSFLIIRAVWVADSQWDPLTEESHGVEVEESPYRRAA